MERELIAVVDLECSPHLAWVFGSKWEPSVVEYKRYSETLSFSWKWVNGEQITKSIKDYRSGERGLLTELWGLMNRAEIIVGWNSQKFDLRYLSARFAKFGMSPPSPYRSVDLIKTSRSKFLIPSNSLDEFNNYFSLKRKLDNEKGLFIKCAEGDKEAFKKLKIYNKNDTLITEQAYKFLLPWIQTHPNLSAYTEKSGCPKCSSRNLEKRGFIYTQSSKFQRLFCKDCKSWCRGRNNLLDIKPFV